MKPFIKKFVRDSSVAAGPLHGPYPLPLKPNRFLLNPYGHLSVGNVGSVLRLLSKCLATWGFAARNLNVYQNDFVVM